MKVKCFCIKSEEDNMRNFLNGGVRVSGVRLRANLCFIEYDEIESNLIITKFTVFNTQRASHMLSSSGSNPMDKILSLKLASNFNWDVLDNGDNNGMTYIIFWEYQRLPLTKLTVNFVKQIVVDIIDISICSEIITMQTSSNLSYSEQANISDIFDIKRFYSKDRKEKASNGDFISYFEKNKNM